MIDNLLNQLIVSPSDQATPWSIVIAAISCKSQFESNLAVWVIKSPWTVSLNWLKENDNDDDDNNNIDEGGKDPSSFIGEKWIERGEETFKRRLR